MIDPENLQGTTRTLDGALGDKTKEPIGQGLVSRSGWALVDDSTRPLFDSADFRFLQGEKSPWPWVMERPAGEKPGSYVDWYFFGYGHDYRKALGDYVRVAGRIPLPPRFAFGAWWSRYWAYTDQELDELVRGFHENDTPLDVLVIDMDWHISRRAARGRGRCGPVGPRTWAGPATPGTRCSFPIPTAFLEQAARRGPEGHAQSASGLGHPAVGGGLSGDGARHGHRSGDEEIRALRPHQQEMGDQLLQPGPAPAGETGHRLLVARLAAGAHDTNCPA